MKRTLFWSGISLILGCAAPSCVKQELSPVPDTDSPRFVIRASLEESPLTRTALAVQDDGSALTLWKSGDTFKMFTSEGETWTFSSQANGVTDADFVAGQDGVPSGSAFYMGYPADRFARQEDGALYATLSSTQTAAAGGISEGQHLAVGYNTDAGSGVTFRNVVSLLRFRLSGSSVSSLTRVTLTAAENIAGDIVVGGVSGSVPSATASSTVSTYKSASYYPSNEYTVYSENATKVITLTGPFSTGTDYYIAVLPGTYSSGMKIRFEDEYGRYVEKTTSTAATFARSTIHDLGTFEIGTLSNPVSHQLMRATKGSKPVTFVFLSQGFAEGTSGRNDRLEYDKAVREECDFIFSVAPFNAYKEYFNVYALFRAATGVDATEGCVASPFSGFTQTTSGFSLSNGSENSILAWVAENCPDIQDGSHASSEVPVLMLLNYRTVYRGFSRKPDNGTYLGAGLALSTYCINKADTGLGEGNIGLLYGGNHSYQEAASVSATSGTRTLGESELAALGYSAVTMDGAATMRAVCDWKNVMFHEGMGHVFGRLCDDYWQDNTTTYSGSSLNTKHSLTPKDALNASSSATNTPWSDFEAALASYTSSDSRYDRHETSQGGFASYMYGIWRPERVGCMMDDRAYFPAYERYLIAERIMVLSGSISGSTTGKEHSDWPFSEFFTVDLATDGPHDPLRD